MMKKLLLLFISTVLITSSVLSSDAIYLKKGGTLIGKVLYSNSLDVTFQQLSTSGGPTEVLTVAKEDIGLIIYENGQVESNPDNATAQSDDDTTNLCLKGRIDANRYYKGSGPLWGSLCCTGGLNPLLGVILTAIEISSPPKESKLAMPHTSESLNPQYQSCYRQEAYKIKKKKAWTGFGIGCGIYAVFIVMYLGSN
jgi:hypothetical protein